MSNPEMVLLNRRALRLEWLTIGWNVVEGVLCVTLGLIASALSMVAFGLDSFIEVSASVVLLWRLRYHANDARAEKRARQLVGVSFILLATYIVIESVRNLLAAELPEKVPAGILIAMMSAVTMPILARAKRRVAAQMKMSSLASEAAQTDICGYLSIILLVSLVVYQATGIWWIDAVGSLLMVPIIAYEGYQSFRGKSCGCH